MTSLHWQLRNYAKEMRSDGRLSVLLMLILHSNIRLRCWPSVDLLSDETGWSLASVTAAKAWLIEHRAVALVPYGKRVDDELKLPIRQHVYQLTGVIAIDGKTLPYLYMTPEAEDSVKAILANILPTEISEVLPTEISVGRGEGIPVSKGIPSTALPPKPKPERKRDELFDALGSALFDIRVGDPIGKSEAGRIAAVKKELLTLDTNVTATDISRFANWYKGCYPNVSIPRDAGKLATHWRQWRATRMSFGAAASEGETRFVDGNWMKYTGGTWSQI